MRVKWEILALSLLGAFISANSPTSAGKPEVWSPADLPKALLQLVPERHQRGVFRLDYWMKSLPHAVSEGTWKGVNLVPAFQCGAFENAMLRVAAQTSAAGVPTSVTAFRARGAGLWELPQLHDAAMDPNWLDPARGVHVIDPSMRPYPAILDHQDFEQWGMGLPSFVPLKPGDVAFYEVPFKGTLAHPFSRSVLVTCVSEVPSWRMEKAGDTERKVFGAPEYAWDFSQFFWRKDGSRASPETGKSPWWGFGIQVSAALQAYVLTNGKSPDTLDDLESVFGKRNKKAWTPEMERIMNEYHIPRLKAALASSG